MRLIYETKPLKTAKTVRKFVMKMFNTDCSVAVHPNHTIINTKRSLAKDELKKLNDWMSENMDGRLMKHIIAGVAK